MAKLLDWASRRKPTFFDADTDFAAERKRRLRIVVFAAVFLGAAMASLAYLFTRSPEYQAVARLQITPSSIPSQVGAASPVSVEGLAKSLLTASTPLLTEIQVLTSRPMVETAVTALKNADALPADMGPDPVTSAQHMLSTEVVDGTNIVLLQADGTKREFLPRLVNQIVNAYQADLEGSYKKLADSTDAGVSEELRLLEQKVAAKRAEADAFRARYDIVSLERDENEVLSRVKGLGASLNEANARVATAEGHLKALRDSTTAAVRAKDNPTIADMERRASEMRGTLKELQRKYTPQYLDLDPDAKALRARLSDLEQQIQSERTTSQATAITEAQQELASAREAANQLKQQATEAQQNAGEFTVRFGQYKALQEDLNQLEELRRNALERQAKLEAQERETASHMAILESASVPQKSIRPLYALDTVLSLVGSLILGFFAVWFVEFFGPRAKQDPLVVLREPWGMNALPYEAPPVQLTVDPPNAALNLPAPGSAKRELSDAEVAALLRAAGDDARLAIILLLMGISPDELIVLRSDAIDPIAGVVNIPGESARTIGLERPLLGSLANRLAAAPRSPTLMRSANGAPMSMADLDDLIMCAAYDAMLEQAEDVTAMTLRHTYIVYLLNQGIRLADLRQIVGQVPRDELVSYVRLGSPETRQPLEQIDRIFPVLRQASPTA